jgi:hypothetical protein
MSSPNKGTSTGLLALRYAKQLQQQQQQQNNEGMVASRRLVIMNRVVKYAALTKLFSPSRWCCYGMLWVGAAFAIATVSTCDFQRIAVRPADDIVTFSDDDATLSAKGGLFCVRLEFRGEVVQQRWSQFDEAVEADETDDNNASRKAAQAFGVLAAIFIPVALILYHVAFFVRLPNRAVAKGIWWTIRILAIAAVVSVSLTFIFYEGLVAACRPEEVECGVGAAAVLAGINAIMLIILTVCLFLSGPPQAPFRCGSCNCCEDDGSVRRTDEGKTLPGGSDIHGKVQTTTTEEIMEDGRRSITTETVDAYGNKKIVKRIAAAGQDVF